MHPAMPLLEVDNLCQDFKLSGKAASMRALNQVSFDLYPGRALAMVGESGSGKSTSARLITLMYPPSSGEIRYRGQDIAPLRHGSRTEQLAYRRAVQMIFQDPFGSLNPTHTIRYHLARPLQLHRRLKGAALEQEVFHLLERVGLTPAQATAEKFPHQLSGGQRQRVNIARILAVGAKVILADEPTSMLDVSLRLGILNLLEDLKQQEKLAFLYITHDLATARYFAEDTAVMYVGHMVEWGDTASLIDHPAHPYTQLLLSAVPEAGRSIMQPLEGGRKGDIPLWTAASEGCPFASRCLHAGEACRRHLPDAKQLAENHYVRCHLHS
ncbi:ABC transporter ATP-binding protein [Balneatrix alpica]|uniref:ABC transporter ATP-binding protein n=1 Tax=Balneatrix alpica TaxID=75684 RepID=UPI00273A57C8|nr:ABC transporter ATP-binding protein [Balneatrix alpica]